MFEEMTDRIAGTLLTGLDVAVEFATLGEFRLVEAAAPAPFDHEGLASEATAPALPLARRRQRASKTERGPKTQRVPKSITPERITPDLLPRPATAIARATASAKMPAQPKAKHRGAKSSSVVPSAPRRRPGSPAKPHRAPATRVRGGAVPAGTQLCLFSR